MEDVLRTMWPIMRELLRDSDANPASIYASLQALNLWQDTHDDGRALPGTELMGAGREEALALALYACRFAFACYGAAGSLFVHALSVGGAKPSAILDRMGDDDTAAFCRDAGLPRSAVLLVSGDAAVGVPRHFVALDHDNRTVVLSIRGSMSLADAFTDLLALNVPFCGGEAHQGIANSARAVYASTIGIITSALRERMSTTGEMWRLLVTGHSLGAGTSILLTILLNHNIATGAQSFPDGVPITCLAFAPPPVFTAPPPPTTDIAAAAAAAAAAATTLSPLTVPAPECTPEQLAAVLPVSVQRQIISWVHHDDLVSRLSLHTLRDVARILTRIGLEEPSFTKRLLATHFSSLNPDSKADLTRTVDGVLRLHETEWLHKWYGIQGGETLATEAQLKERLLASATATATATAGATAAAAPVAPVAVAAAASTSGSRPTVTAAAVAVAAPAAGGAAAMPDSPSTPTAAVAFGTAAVTLSGKDAAARVDTIRALQQPQLMVPGAIYCFRSPEEFKHLVPYKASTNLGYTDDDASILAGPGDAPINSVGKAAAQVEQALYDASVAVGAGVHQVTTSTSALFSSAVSSISAAASAAAAAAAAATSTGSSASPAAGSAAAAAGRPGSVLASAPAPVAAAASSTSSSTSSSSSSGGGIAGVAGGLFGKMTSKASSLLAQAKEAVVSTPPATPHANAAAGTVTAAAAAATTGSASAVVTVKVPSPSATGAVVVAAGSGSLGVSGLGPLITTAQWPHLSILPTTSRAWRDHLPDMYVHVLRHVREVVRFEKQRLAAVAAAAAAAATSGAGAVAVPPATSTSSSSSSSPAAAAFRPSSIAV